MVDEVGFGAHRDGKRELEQIGLIDGADVESGYVVRMPRRIRSTTPNTKGNVAVLADWLAAARAERVSGAVATVCTATTTRITRC